MFGVKLDVPHSQLTKIKKSHHEGDIELCKIDMFQYWLDNKLVPTWNEVIRALEETDKVTLASQIKHDYLLSPASEEEGMHNRMSVIPCLTFVFFYYQSQNGSYT